MKKKTLIFITLAILFPIIWTYFQFNEPGQVTFKLPEYYADLNCNMKSSGQYSYNCSCPIPNIQYLGFPIMWTHYGRCGLDENQNAKMIDLGLGIFIELILVYLVVKGRKKLTTPTANS